MNPNPSTLRNALTQRAGAMLLLILASTPSLAIDFGPDGMFSFTGFAQFATTQQGSYCLNCQVADRNAPKHLRAADAIIPGRTFGDATTTNWQVQPYLKAQVDLGGGFKLSGLLSQRWRQGSVNGSDPEIRYGGTVDVPDYWYEKNLALRHEDYGQLIVGSMVSRAYAESNYPYGGNVGLSDAWGATGAGYGMLANAIRVGTRNFDVADGDLYLEATYDQGNTNFTRLKPSFLELYAQYRRGGLALDMMYQDGINGGAGAWGQSPFSGVTPFSADDTNLAFKGNRQSIALLLARYTTDSRIELSGGLRRNQWSGADLVFANNYTTVFNADFNTPVGTGFKGYAANSMDVLLGARYFMGPWTFSTGMVHHGTADTANPSDRGQTNSALINTFGAAYNFGNGWKFESTLGMVRYAKLGLSPMSMPGNASATNVDSRITTEGRWLTLGMVYTF